MGASSENNEWERSKRIYEEYINVRNVHQIIFVECIALGGVFLMFTGYRYLRFAMFMSGFWVAFSVFYVFSPPILHHIFCCDKGQLDTIHLVSSGLVGVLVGLLISSLYRFGVLLIGKCLGILISMALIHSTIDFHTTNKLAISMFVGVVALIVASLTWKFERIILIMATSCMGSYMALCGIDIFVRSNFSLIILSLLVYFRDALLISFKNKDKLPTTHLPQLHKLDKQNNLGPIFVSIWMFISVLSALIQCCVTSRDVEKGGKVCPWSAKNCCSCLLPCHDGHILTHPDQKSKFQFR